MTNTIDTAPLNTTDTWIVDTAVTTKGHPVTLVSDPEGDYLVVERTPYRCAEPILVAMRLGPGDRPKAGLLRFAVLEPPPHERI